MDRGGSELEIVLPCYKGIIIIILTVLVAYTISKPLLRNCTCTWMKLKNVCLHLLKLHTHVNIVYIERITPKICTIL